MPSIAPEKRARIIALLEEGRSTRSIAFSEGVSQATVWRLCKRKEETSPLKDRPRSGRPRLLGERHERNAVRLLISGKCGTAVEVQRELKSSYGTTISAQTVRRALVRNGLCARVKRKKPLLLKRHRKQQLCFAQEYRHWTLEDWKKVIWSDESKFQIFGSDGRQYCWKKPGEPLCSRNVRPTVKHGGGCIMVWGCMTAQGIGFLTRIDGGLDAKLYQQILNDELMDTIEWYNLKRSDVVFQHDNDPKHTAKSTKEWLDQSGLQVLDWPAQSPDLNPIEHLWNEVDRRLRNLPEPPRSREDLWNKLQDVWNGIDLETITKLIGTMQQPIQDVLKAKGGYTQW
jgi:transposase